MKNNSPLTTLVNADAGYRDSIERSDFPVIRENPGLKSMKSSYDFAVIGAGVFGAWTAWHLRQSGASVAIVDAYGPGNSRSSSGGETRLIRMGYGPDELYTRWALRSLPQWLELSKRTGTILFEKTGVLWLSDESDPYLQRLEETLRKCDVVSETLPADAMHQRWPQLSLGENTAGVFEPQSGALMARRAVQALMNQAMENGMDYRLAAVSPPENKKQFSSIQLNSGEALSAGAFIFACGPWLPKLFPELLAGMIRPTRQEVFFVGVPAGIPNFQTGCIPAWLHHNHPDRPYVLPDIENRGLKIAFDRHGEEIDPDTALRVVNRESMERVRSYVNEHIPQLRDAPFIETRVCQYENTSNGDFLIDQHPEMKNVWIVGGGSGHGFKHGPAVGEYVSSRILNNGTAEPRFSLESKSAARGREVF
jgi:monomeric sarcosine oxidase